MTRKNYSQTKFVELRLHRSLPLAVRAIYAALLSPARVLSNRSLFPSKPNDLAPLPPRCSYSWLHCPGFPRIRFCEQADFHALPSRVSADLRWVSRFAVSHRLVSASSCVFPDCARPAQCVWNLVAVVVREGLRLFPSFG